MDTLLTTFNGLLQPQSRDTRSIIERSVSFLLLALICIFALNSIGNVQKYVGRFHDHWTGDALGIAFGTVVFVCAYIAATTHGHTRWVSIVIGTVFGIASAQFQTELYTLEGMNPSTARALSYIPILAGEVGLALLESLYSRQHQAQQEVDATSQLTQQLHAQEQIIATLKEQLDTATTSLAVAQDELATHAEPTSQAQMQPQTSAPNQVSLNDRNGDLHAANDVRAAMKEQKKAAVLQLLQAAKRALPTGELTALLQDEGWEASTHSVRRYCQELADEGVVVSENRKWQLSTSQ